MFEDKTSKFIVIDAQELHTSIKGRKIVNAIQSSNSEEFRTKRGRRAFFLKVDTFQKIKGQMGFDIEEGYDGTWNCVLPADTQETAGA